MLTSNTEILRKLGALEQQWNDCQAEIDRRIKEQRIDNDGYLIVEGDEGKYSLVGKDFYMKSLQTIVSHANQKLNGCKCEEK
jgi:hypothetical protein